MASFQKNASIDDLLTLMARLRDPHDGCPWDLKQDYKSIAPSTLEEAYEVVDTIEREDWDHLREELGDLLFQVVFYAQLAREENRFDFDDIARAMTEKLLRRHPHVFPDGTLESRVGPHNRPPETQVKEQWESIKRRERGDKGQQSLLADVPTALPAMTRAVKLQKRASSVGFDWTRVDGVLEQLQEEIGELREAMASAGEDSIREELGDTLFCLVNLARHLKQDPEKALRAANHKFERRFTYIEETLARRGDNLETTDVEVMETLWDEAKAVEKGD